MHPINIFERMIVVDDFYRDPDAVRRYALEQERENETHGQYAGVMTHNSFLTEEHTQTFSMVVGHKLTPSTPFTGKFRFTKQGEIGKQDIHFDPGDNNCCWGGVIYLSPNVENTEGTIFWKHKETGLEEIPRSLEGIRKYGWNGVEDLKQFLDTDGVTHSKWDKVFSVPYRYNRMILFRPWKFHSPGPGFGDTIETARLIQTFFWSPANNLFF